MYGYNNEKWAIEMGMSFRKGRFSSSIIFIFFMLLDRGRLYGRRKKTLKKNGEEKGIDVGD